MPDERQSPWRLNSFLDQLILELDRAQDTLAVKGINRRLTYTVKDLALELQLFPHFDGRELRFLTAKPGESGAAKVAFQLGSITDRQIREVTSEPMTADDVSFDAVEELDPETKTTLERIGVKSARDLERMREKNIDLTQVSEKPVDYNRLAGIINRAKRRANRPSISSATIVFGQGTPELRLVGENLTLRTPEFARSLAGGEFPIAYLNEDRVEVLSAGGEQIRLAVPETLVRDGMNRLRVIFDPYAVLTMELQG